MLEVPTKGVTLSNDILRPVHERYTESIEGKGKLYNTPRTGVQGMPRLDGEMVEALDNLDKVLKDPTKYLSTRTDFTNEEIGTLKAWSGNQFTIISAVRTAIDQMDVTNPAKTGTLDSKHLVGVATDFNFNGQPYDHKRPNNSSNYKLFVKVANTVGLAFPRMGHPIEGNHAVLNTYQNSKFRNTAKYCEKLNLYLEGYEQAISAELTRLSEAIKGKNKSTDATLAKLAALHQQVKGKQLRINQLNAKIAELKTTYRLKDKELQDLANLLASLMNREKELRGAIAKKERGLRDRERLGKEPGEVAKDRGQNRSPEPPSRPDPGIDRPRDLDPPPRTERPPKREPAPREIGPPIDRRLR
jgi:hypothetical protein